jgi:hypothetical protein
MLREHARPKMKVVFGRPNGEKTIGIIVKCNPKFAKVQTLEERGRGRGSDEGATWKVAYSLMEPLPVDGDKHNVEIKRNGEDQIIVGVTTFHAHYADSNPQWRVIQARGRGTYVCEVTAESIDWQGVKKAFLTEEILGAIRMASVFDTIGNDHDRFYTNLKPGQIVHYNNGFDEWVRCKVVVQEDENVLKPFALVGDWKPHSLARRRNDGSIDYGHYIKQIVDGETFSPHASNLYENGAKPRNGISPVGLTPINYELPPMTQAEEEEAKLWQYVNRLHDATSTGRHMDNPPNARTILTNVLEIIQEYVTA